MESQSSVKGRVPILKIPLRFFGIATDPSAPIAQADIGRLNAYVDRLRDELVRIGGKSPIPRQLTDAIKTMPIVLGRLPSDYEVANDALLLLHEHMYYVYNAYLREKDEDVERVLSGYPEYSYYLLSADVKPGQKLTEDQLNLVRQLFTSPVWAIQWLNAHYDEELFRRFITALFHLRDYDAQAAHCWHWLKTRNAPTEVKTEELVKVLEVISPHPYLAIIVALEFPSISIENLVTHVQQSPMWTYNWLRAVKRGRTHNMLETLLAWPPWAVQYINDLRPDDADEIIGQLKVKPPNPWWEEWLQDYIRRWEQKRV